MSRKRNLKFIASKININENIFSANKHDLVNLLPEAILVEPEIKTNSWTWKISDTREINEDNNRLIYGTLIKSRFESVTVVDDNKLDTYDIPKPVAIYSRFMYDSISEVLVFEELTGIDRDQFIKHFQSLLLSAKYEIGEVIIKLIPIKEEIYERINDIEVLTKIEFDFIPPNFHGKDTFKSLDTIIERENATRMKAALENKEGLNKQGTFINQGIEKVSNAYGDVKAYGYNTLPSRSKRHKSKRKKVKFNSREMVHSRQYAPDSNEELLGKLKSFVLEMRNLIL